MNIATDKTHMFINTRYQIIRITRIHFGQWKVSFFKKNGLERQMVHLNSTSLWEFDSGTKRSKENN